MFGDCKRLIIICVVVLCLLFPVAVYLCVITPGMANHRNASNLGVIATALRGYHSAYGTFPPPFVANEHGVPIHSWRVLILPFLSEDQLFADYSFDEPWNGPHNILLAKKMPSVFRNYTNGSATDTSYLAVIGPGTLWSGDAMMNDHSLAEIMNTIVVAEVNNSGVAWSDPRDISSEYLVDVLLRDSRHRLGWPYTSDSLAIRANGIKVWLKTSMSAEELFALLSSD